VEKTINVLIIDDDPMVSHLNRKYTEMVSGFKVLDEINIDNEMQLDDSKLNKADLLLLDIYLPGKNGIEILKEIRAANKDLDIIIISASKDPLHISEAMKWGVVDYLIKPFDFNRLKQSLKDYKKLKHRLEGSGDLGQKDIDSLMGKNKYSNQNSNRKDNKDNKDDKNNKDNKKEIKNSQDKSEKIIQCLPKGLNQMTLTKIKQFMKNKEDPLTTKRIAREVQLSRVTVQRYLKYMLTQKIVKISKKYGTVGRPKHYYKLIKDDSAV